MKTLITAFLSMVAFDATVGPIQRVEVTTQTLLKGIDVSANQKNIKWDTLPKDGVVFAYIKATEGKDNKNPEYSSQSTGAAGANIIHGGYHVALPNQSDGKQQANWFIDNGGSWTDNGKTLPGALSLEYNPSGGSDCYGLDAVAMVNWIREFSDAYQSKVKRHPVIFTTNEWWITCTSGDSGFATTSPLWVRRHASKVGELPEGWKSYHFWQYAEATPAGPVPGNQDYYNGDIASLKSFVTSKS